VFLAIPNRYYESVRGWSSSVLEPITVSNQYFPITEKIRQVDWHGGFTAAAGHALYTARAYPSWYWNRTAFVCEPTGHLTTTFTLQPSGAGFSAYYGWNLAASDDEWTSPIMAEVGPDGHVWMIDWYNFIVQHNPTPQGFKTGRGNAYETPLRDQTHGRIYRIVHRDAPDASTRMPTLNPDDPSTLLVGLRSDNQFWRSHAQRLLVERGKADVVPGLLEILKKPSVDAIGLDPSAIHALWTLQGLGAIDADPRAREAAEAALAHPSAGVRRNALLVLPQDESATSKIVEARLLDDSDAQVRLAALLAIAERPATPASARALADILASGAIQGDRLLRDALTSAAARNDFEFLKAIASKPESSGKNPDSLEVTGRVAEHYAREGPASSVGAILEASADAPAPVAESIVCGLLRGWPKGVQVPVAPGLDSSIKKLAKRLPSSGRGALVNLAGRWGIGSLEPLAREISDSFLKVLRDPSKPEADRIKAAGELVEFRPRDGEIPGKVAELLTPRTSPTLASGLVESLARGESPKVGPSLLEALPSLTPSVRPTILKTLLARREWTTALVDGLERGIIRPSELTLDQKQALASHPEAALRDRAKRLFEQGGGLPDADRQKVIDRLSPLVLEGGDATAGKKVFTEQCAKCHRHGGEGGRVGPDLSGMAAHPRAELLVHILDPSRSVEGNFVQYTVATTDGRVINGLLSSESKNAVELTDAEGKRQMVARNEIDQIAASRKSLMPEGFEKQVSPSQLADLLAFLTARGKFFPLDLRKVATIPSTRGMFYDPNADAERLIFPDWSPKEFAGVPFVLVDPQGDRVPNAIMLHGPHGEFPPRMPRTVEIPCGSSAKTIHFLSGISGWGYNGGEVRPTVSLVVRLHYSSGKTEDHPLSNGVHFADYIRVVDVPESKLAFKLRNQQVRYFAIPTQRDEPIDRIELIKGPDETAPVVMAITLESR
jgi:putative heme-binding domain-containing protein